MQPRSLLRSLHRCFASTPAPAAPAAAAAAAAALPRAPARVAARDTRRATAREQHLAACSSSLPTFAEMIALRGLPPLARAPPTTLMVNIGKLCNLACRHCHVESSPTRTIENMDARTCARVLQLLRASPSIRTLDVTGGAPELNAHFRALVQGARALGLAVTSRCNLSVLLLPGQEGTPAFLAAQGVRVVASLPSTSAPVVDRQRGAGVWEASLAGLRALRSAGYGAGGHALDLIFNPAGARLPPPQVALEEEFRGVLLRDHGITFRHLLTLTNMPIKRFADDLVKSGEYESYMGLLAANFNPATVPEVMCRSTISVGWDGRLWDCDFNQALEVPLGAAAPSAGPLTLWNIDSFDGFEGRPISTTKACYGCTAADGSSCGGALTKGSSAKAAAASSGLP